MPKAFALFAEETRIGNLVGNQRNKTFKIPVFPKPNLQSLAFLGTPKFVPVFLGRFLRGTVADASAGYFPVRSGHKCSP